MEAQLISATHVPTMANVRPATAGVEASVVPLAITASVMPAETTWLVPRLAN